MTVACDPNFDDVVLLAHFDTPNTFVDSSSFLQAITATGNGAADTTNKEFGSSSLGFVADGNFNGVSVADAPSLDFGTGDWVIEGFIFWPTINPGGNSAWIEKYQFTTLYPYQIVTGSSNGIAATGADGVGTTAYSLSGPSSGDGSLTPGAFNYIVLQRSGSTFSLYVNGFLADTDTYAGSLASNNYPVLIGAQGSGYTANIDEVRFTKGFARYSGSTIPVPTVPFGVACPVGTAIPDVTGELPSDGETDITNVGLTVDQTFTESSETIPAGRITRTVPTAGTIVTPGSAVSIYVSTGSGGEEIPPVTGQTIPEAEATIAPTVFVLGQQFSEASPDVPKGRIIRQSPVAGSHAADGTAIDVWVSTGPGGVIVPQLEGDSSAAGALALAAVGLGVGPIGFSTEPGHEIGTIVDQTILAGTVVPLGTKVGFTISILLAPFDIAKTVISQYANSPTILALVNDMAEWIDPRTNFEAFYTFVWNVDTAQGFGLDIWGRIVDVSRLLHIPGDSAIFGFSNADRPYDWQPWNQGTFNSGNRLTQTYVLTDDAYRVLILTKALANIAATNSPSLNALLRNLFPGRGKCYVVDQGNMSMQFVFEFSLTAVELAILTQSGALPHPAGVSFSVLVVPTTGFFGFRQGGGQTFGHGPFYGG